MPALTVAAGAICRDVRAGRRSPAARFSRCCTPRNTSTRRRSPAHRSWPHSTGSFDGRWPNGPRIASHRRRRCRRSFARSTARTATTRRRWRTRSPGWWCCRSASSGPIRRPFMRSACRMPSAHRFGLDSLVLRSKLVRRVAQENPDLKAMPRRRCRPPSLPRCCAREPLRAAAQRSKRELHVLNVAHRAGVLGTFPAAATSLAAWRSAQAAVRAVGDPHPNAPPTRALRAYLARE